MEGGVPQFPSFLRNLEFFLPCFMLMPYSVITDIIYNKVSNENLSFKLCLLEKKDVTHVK